MEYRKDGKPVCRLSLDRIRLYCHGIWIFAYEFLVVSDRPERRSCVIQRGFQLGIVIFVLVLVFFLPSEMDGLHGRESMVYPSPDCQRRDFLKGLTQMPCRLYALSFLSDQVAQLVVDLLEIVQLNPRAGIGQMPPY